jgi:hypothetical protein
VAELVEQIRVTRLQPGASGNVHFSMKSFLVNQGSMNDSLMQGPYADFAMIPATPWLTTAAPPTPSLQWTNRNGSREVQLGTAGSPAPWQWLVQVRNGAGWRSTVVNGNVRSLPIASGDSVNRVTVRAVNRVGVESPPTTLSLSDTAFSGDSAGGPKSSRSRSLIRGRSDGR